VGNQPGKIDWPTCREDLVRKAAADALSFGSAFDWINDRESLRVTSDPRNRGLTAPEIRDLARDWINDGNAIDCVRETREDYKDRRHFHYDIIIEKLAGFPRGLYVYMELANRDEDNPTVNLLDAHPP
jgi:hypothetical protein